VKQDMTERMKLLKEFWAQRAPENIHWVRENPMEAARLIWFLIGYSGLCERFEGEAEEDHHNEE